jgi:antitoxin component YwqK of YwqJK toxin-antitoxin module
MGKFHMSPDIASYNTGGRSDSVDKDGKRTGWWNINLSVVRKQDLLYIKGLVVQERDYVYDRLESITYFHSGGKGQTVLGIAGGKALYKETRRRLTPKGLKLRHGTYEEYDKDGNLFLKAEFRKNKVHGPIKFYWPNGKVREACRSTKGLLGGFVRTYYRGGEPKLSVEFKSGQCSGHQILWDKHGIVQCRALRSRHFAHEIIGSRASLAHMHSKVNFLMAPNFYQHLALEAGMVRGLLRRPATFYRRLMVSAAMNTPISKVPICL